MKNLNNTPLDAKSGLSEERPLCCLESFYSRKNARWEHAFTSERKDILQRLKEREEGVLGSREHTRDEELKHNERHSKPKNSQDLHMKKN